MRTISRDDVISQAVDDCMKDLYSLVQPSVEWDDFVKQCKEYSDKYRIWEQFNHAFHNKEKDEETWKRELAKYPDWENKSINYCIGPKPYEFYYLPKEVMKEIVDSYIYTYRLDQKQELLDTIEILKDYCKDPIVDKYVKRNGNEPGYKSYDHPVSLELCITHLIIDSNLSLSGNYGSDIVNLAKEIVNKFFEFLDMAGNFFCWNKDLNTFNMNVYLGVSPNSNKEAVIENWKKYKGVDIEIDESKYKDDEYYD